MTKKDITIFQNFVFFGSGEFAATVLRILVDAGWIPQAVVTNPDRPVGRKKILTPSAVGVVAKEKELKMLKFEKLDADAFEALANLKVQVAVVTDYGVIIPKKFLNIYPKGSVNIHPSLLPLYRGASPLQSVILAGESRSGVVVMLMDEKMDHGPIISHHKSNITNQTYPELRDELAHAGGKLLIETLPQYLEGSLEPQEQNHDKATFTKLIRKSDGLINWSKHTADHIQRMIRAYEPWPGVSTSIKQGSGELRVKMLAAQVVSPVIGEPGSITKSPDGPEVVCAKNSSLLITQLHVEGKNSIDGKSFLNGYPDLKKFE